MFAAPALSWVPTDCSCSGVTAMLAMGTSWTRALPLLHTSRERGVAPAAGGNTHKREHGRRSDTFHRPPREHPPSVPTERAAHRPAADGAGVRRSSGLIQVLFPVVGGVGHARVRARLRQQRVPVHRARDDCAAAAVLDRCMRWSQQRGGAQARGGRRRAATRATCASRTRSWPSRATSSAPRWPAVPRPGGAVGAMVKRRASGSAGRDDEDFLTVRLGRGHRPARPRGRARPRHEPAHGVPAGAAARGPQAGRAPGDPAQPARGRRPRARRGSWP